MRRSGTCGPDLCEYLDVSPTLFRDWAKAIEPMPLDEYAALLALLTDVIKDVEAVI